MRIVSMERAPLSRLTYLNAAGGGRVRSDVLNMQVGRVDHLPTALEAVLVTSDLQGVVRTWARGPQTTLLGVHLAQHCVALSNQGVLPPLSRVGVVLAGDLYASPDGTKRGASGDVSAVWAAFAAHFRWVVGVEGNHDIFDAPAAREAVRAMPNVHLLDGDVCTVDGLTIGGVGLILANKRKPGRRPMDEFEAKLHGVLRQNPALLVLHEGPDGGPQQMGSADVRRWLWPHPGPLVVCGHRHWHDPLYTRGPRQVLNTDHRAVLLRAR